MTESEVKEKLKSVRFIQCQLDVLSETVNRYRHIAEGMNSNSGIGSGKSDTRCNSTEKSMLRLAETIERFETQKTKLADTLSSVSTLIAQLDDAELEAVLIHRYLLFHTVEQTASAMNYHVNSIKKKEKKAIAKVCTKMS